MGRERSRTFHFDFDLPPEKLWPVLTDTARFNEATSFPQYTLEETPRPDGTMSRVARARYGPFPIVWDEIPAEWVAPHVFAQTRRFRNGPIRSLGARIELAARNGGTSASFTASMEPRGVLGRLILAAGFFTKVGRAVDRMWRGAVLHAAGLSPIAFEMPPPKLAPGARERIPAMVEAIEQGPYGHGLAQRLADYVLSAGDVDAARVRPLRLARLWGVERRQAVEACLAAVGAGLLGIFWDVMCPRCRGPKVSVSGLDELPKGAHCSSCNIDYETDFAANVEVSFRPTPSVRDLADGGYCLSGPQTTPHVLVQQSLMPGESREVAFHPGHGSYRFRTLEAGGQRDHIHEGGGFPAVIADGETVIAGEAGPAGVLRLVNRGAAPRAIVVESRAWTADALTAHQATTMQCFRDLFPGQILRPGEDMAVGNVTLMFTDLKGSTALYERLGDGAAYRLVREHFAFLAAAIRRHDGALVKTIGDAVMAAFSDPAQAVRAALAAQRGVKDFNARQAGAGVVIKMGVHAGPCIAVTLNGRLDYFGSNVNLAARLQGESAGDDIVLSESLALDPAVAPLIAGRPAGRETVPVKGFDEPVPFIRLRSVS
jgi:class 3 adenylate cyclase